MSRARRSDCPIHFALEAVGDRWTLLIVRDLLLKRRSTYTELQNGGEGIATNILASRLEKMSSDGLASRDDAGRYQLTEKGVALVPILLELIAWGAAHDPNTAASPAYVDRIRDDRAALIAEIHAALPPPRTPGDP